MSRTPYSPFVEKATAPVPWNAGRWLRDVVLGCGSGAVIETAGGDALEKASTPG
jgi:hypothetical protein